jgi:vitamin B12 transporter
MNVKTGKSVLGLVVLALLALLFIEAAPAVAEDSQGVQALDEMVVTATRSKERAVDVPVVTEVITREKIEMSGVTHLGDLLAKYITGHYQKYNGLLSPVGLRGFQTEAHGDDVKGYVLILVDGHRMGTGNAAKINLDRIERVEVTKGPASALYGSAAIGGVVNLITKKGEGDLQGTVSAEYGSFNYMKEQVSAQGELSEKTRFHFTISNEDVDDYDDPDFGQVYNTAAHKMNFGANVTYAFNEDHEVRFGGNFGKLTGEYPSWENGTYSNYVEDYAAHYDKSHGYADAEYNGSFLDGKLDWRGMGYYLWDRNHWYYGSPDPDASQSKYTDKTLGTDHQFTYKFANWNKLLVGFNLEKLEKESEAVSNGLPALPYTPGMEYVSKALFAQDSIDLLDNRVNIIVAGRYDNFELTTRSRQQGNW